MAENQEIKVAAKNDAGFSIVKMAITKSGEKTGDKRVPVGDVEVYIPTLDCFGVEAETKEVDSEGLPIYTDDKMQFLFAAVAAAVKAKARNALVPQTTELKPGNTIAATFEELTASPERTAEHLEIVRNLKKAFAEWLPQTGKSAKVQTYLLGNFSSRTSLALQEPKRREQIKAFIVSFAESLDAEMLAKGQRYLASLIEVCDMAEEEGDILSELDE